MEKSTKRTLRKKLALVFAIIAPFVLSILILPASKAAGNVIVEELKEKIEEKNGEIQKLGQEIKKWEAEIETVGKEANTLKNAVKTLDLSRSKVLKDIKVTNTKVDSTNLNLNKLSIEIKESERKIDVSNTGLAETIKLMNDSGEGSLIEILLKYDDIASFWNEVETLEGFQSGIRQNLNDLKIAKAALEEKIAENNQQKELLELLKSDLNNQQKIIEINKSQKQQLLTETKNTEAEYKKILERNLARKAEFEKELFEFEAQLKIAVDPSSVPSARPGILSWPLENVFVTQMFGKTSSSGRLYASGSHNGVDFRAGMGTRVKSALSGMVSHVGNTDEVNGCYSFGKWVLVKHDNGISTLYSHLSSIRVNPGQSVATEEVIAYSGGAPGSPGAGYSTGPHLHFGAYITEGLRPQRYQSRTPCNGAYLPLADQKAYLDPMVYFPSL